MKKITARQQKFIDNYLANGGNGAAAVAAGYSEKTAKQQAYSLLNLPKHLAIQQEIQNQQKALQAKTGATAESIRGKLWKTLKKAESVLDIDFDGSGYNHRAAATIGTMASELNKMDGNYAVVRQKLELSGGVQVDHAQILNEARKRLEQSRGDNS